MKISLICLLYLFFGTGSSLKAQVKLPSIIRDSMVVQRNTPIHLWGTSSPGENISVKFLGQTYKTKGSQEGKWGLQLPAMKAGGPYNLTVKGKNTIVLHDVLVGDVWLCSGQSNMVHQMRLHSVRYPKEIENANYPGIRQFWIPTLARVEGPLDTLPSSVWKSANPESVLDFSAVAYFFAKALYKKYHIPIGIINASVGGSPIEAWISEQGFSEFPEDIKIIGRNKDSDYINGLMRAAKQRFSTMKRPTDRGSQGDITWKDTAYIPNGWRRIGIPGYWEDQGLKNLNGIVWYRKEIEVPDAMIGKPAKVFLGRIVDADVLYINGIKIGETGYQYPQRRYVLPNDLLKPGKNLFVVRVTNNFSKGGFVPDKPYSLISGNDTVDLKGYWDYKVGAVFAPVKPGGSFGFSAQNQPTALYNAMVAPLINYPIKGMVWYQGESNTGNAAEYAKLQPALIKDWRNKWKNKDLPFLFVQLPGFGDYNYLPSESDWAELREAQQGSLKIANTAMAVAIGLGEWNDIHPDQKKPVGDRLALAAEHIAYGEELAFSGPTFDSLMVKDNKLIISFRNTGSGLIARSGEPLQEFAVAGADKKFFWADAKIIGNTVEVWSGDVKHPKYVRYGWADNPVNPNLFNREGLPASPFQAEIEL